MEEELQLGGKFLVECLNRDGSHAWRLWVTNGVTTPGLTDILGVYFAGGTQKPSWYLGLVDNVNFQQVSSADTLASHPGWQENIAYSQAARPAWQLNAASGTASSSASAAFTFPSGATLSGIFLASNNSKGGSSGILWSTAQLPSPRQIAVGQTLRVSYILRAAGGG